MASSSSNELREQILLHLHMQYNVDDNAGPVLYEQAIQLYHEINTITNFTALNDVDRKILSALVIIIIHYYEFDDSSEYLK